MVPQYLGLRLICPVLLVNQIMTFPDESGYEDNRGNLSDAEEESESTSLPCLEILNRFCLKIKEEAIISSKATDRIRGAAISLLRESNSQSKNQVQNVPQYQGPYYTTSCTPNVLFWGIMKI